VLTVNKGKGTIGLMTTPGCFRAGIYQEALAEAGKTLILQTPDELSETMILVERIKSGDKSQEVKNGLQSLANKIINRGAEILIAACTEFPLVLNKSMFTVPFISSTEVLAKKTVAIALEDY
jgi:aspartate racemase